MADVSSKIKLLEAKLVYMKHMGEIATDHLNYCYNSGEKIVEDVKSQLHDDPNIIEKIVLAHQALEKLCNSILTFNFGFEPTSVTLKTSSDNCVPDISSVSLTSTSAVEHDSNKFVPVPQKCKTEDAGKSMMIPSKKSFAAGKNRPVSQIPDPIPENGIFSNIVYLHGKDPWDFWLGFVNGVNIVENSLHNRCETSVLSPLIEKPKVGDCVLICDDKSKVRCKILSFDESKNMYNVLNVDTGIKSKISINKMYALDKAVAGMPTQAIHCSLKEEYQNLLKSDSITERMLQALMMENNSVSVHDKVEGIVTKFIINVEYLEHQHSQEQRNISVADWLCSFLPSEESRDIQNGKDDEPHDSRMLSEVDVKSVMKNSSASLDGKYGISVVNLLPVGFCEKVYVSCIVSPSEFYITLASCKAILNKLHLNMAKSYNRMKLMFSDKDEACKQIVLYCACFHSDSGSWRRGRVVNWNPPVSKDHVVVHCVDTGDTLTVSWKFLRYLQPEFLELNPLAIRCSLADICPVNPGTKWSDEAISIFKSILEPDCMYKIHIVDQIGTATPSYSVLLTYTENNEEMRINDDLLRLNVATLRLNEEIASWEENGEIQEVQARGKDFDEVWESEEDIPDSRIFFNKKNIQTKCQDIRERECATSKRADTSNVPPPSKLPKVGSVISVEITHVESANQFYVVILNSAVDVELDKQENEYLIRLNDLLNGRATDRKHIVSAPTVGQFVVAKFHEDGHYYRAKVVGIDNKGSVEVFFIDYGNTETVGVEELRAVQPWLLHIPAQAIKCQLANFSPYEHLPENETETALEFFKDFVLNKKLRARVVNILSNSEITVLLYSSGLDIGNTLVNYGFGYKRHCSINTECSFAR